MPDDQDEEDEEEADVAKLQPRMRLVDGMSDESDDDVVEEMSDDGDAEDMFVSRTAPSIDSRPHISISNWIRAISKH